MPASIFVRRKAIRFILSSTLIIGFSLDFQTRAVANDMFPPMAVDPQPAPPDETPKAPEGMVVSQTGRAPLASAQVVLTAGSWGVSLTTDSAGKFFWPPDMPAKVDITIRAINFVPVTFLKVGAVDGMEITLQQAEPAPTLWTGRTSGYGSLTKDNWLDFSFVLPSIAQSDLLNMNPQQIVSPIKDIITVMGQSVPLPSNVSIPKQTENYGIIPITMDKITFRCPSSSATSQMFYATKGRFRFKQVADALLAGKTFVDVLKDVELQSAGRTQGVRPEQAMDLLVNQIVFDQSRRLPKISIPNNTIWTTAALFAENDRYALADVKIVNDSNPASLNMPSGNVKRVLLHTLRDKNSKNEEPKDFWQLSIAEQNEGQAVPIPLGLINPPSKNGLTVTAPIPNRSRDLAAMGTIVNLWLERELQDGNQKYLISTIWWQMYDPQWSSSWRLPDQIMDGVPAGAKLRTEVVFLAGPGSSLRHVTVSSNSLNMSEILSTASHDKKNSSL